MGVIYGLITKAQKPSFKHEIQAVSQTLCLTLYFSIRKTRSQGEQPSNDEILNYSKLFEDEITLENMTHAQLKALCRLLMMPAVGTNNYLRFALRMKLQELKADDKVLPIFLLFLTLSANFSFVSHERYYLPDYRRRRCFY